MTPLHLIKADLKADLIYSPDILLSNQVDYNLTDNLTHNLTYNLPILCTLTSHRFNQWLFPALQIANLNEPGTDTPSDIPSPTPTDTPLMHPVIHSFPTILKCLLARFYTRSVNLTHSLSTSHTLRNTH